MDPTSIMPKAKSSAASKGGVTSLDTILAEQLQLAATLQSRLEIEDLDPREYKELVSSINSIVTMAHRTEQARQTIETYKLFVEVTLTFLKSRSDSMGEDFIKELRASAATLRSSGAVDSVVRTFRP